jgi:predicted transcriptional regulator
VRQPQPGQSRQGAGHSLSRFRFGTSIEPSAHFSRLSLPTLRPQAMLGSVNSDNREHLVHVGAKVESALAEAVRQLADNGDRSLSREIRRAIAEHVERSTDPGASPPPGRSVVDEGEGGNLAGDRRPPSAQGQP